jgi:CCR4-NOT transcription complex subunit 1
LVTKQPHDFPASVVPLLSSGGQGYNLPIISALVVYTGTAAHQILQTNKTTLSSTPAATMFKQLVTFLDPEGKFTLINAMVNQLRYPNTHTYYFRCMLLIMFAECDEATQESIARVLLERLICNRPHPWGLLVTFIELIKNPVYGFWHRPFMRKVPEVERIFETVARSCLGHAAADAAGLPRTEGGSDATA